MSDDELERIKDLPTEGCGSPQRRIDVPAGTTLTHNITVLPPSTDHLWGLIHSMAYWLCGSVVGWEFHQFARWMGWVP